MCAIMFGFLLKHENIVRVYGYFLTGVGDIGCATSLVIIMERCTCSLEEAMRTWQWDQNFFCRVLEGVSCGMALVHGNSILHRDLKPGQWDKSN